MALRYVNPRAASNGSGTSWADALNTFAGLTWGAHRYGVGPGTLAESIVLGANGATVTALDPADMPVIDGASLGTSTSSLNFNSRTGCEVMRLRFVNSLAESPNAAVRVSGTSGNKLHHCDFYNNRAAVQVNSGAHRIYRNTIDIGHVSVLTIGYGIRLNSASTVGTRVYGNRLVCTSLDGVEFEEGTTFRSGIEAYQATGNFIERNIIAAPYADQILLIEADDTEVCFNSVGALRMLDGIDVRSSDGVLVRNNTTRHFKSWASHAGPAMFVGDNVGTGVTSTNCTIENNLMWADSNLPLAYKFLGDGNIFRNNMLWRTGGDGDAVVNYQTTQGGAISSRNMGAWLALELDTDSQNIDPQINANGRPLVRSPLMTAGYDLGYLRDIDGRQGRGFVGAHCPAALRVWPGN